MKKDYIPLRNDYGLRDLKNYTDIKDISNQLLSFLKWRGRVTKKFPL
jgi:hypothetical protein